MLYHSPLVIGRSDVNRLPIAVIEMNTPIWRERARTNELNPQNAAFPALIQKEECDSEIVGLDGLNFQFGCLIVGPSVWKRYDVNYGEANQRDEATSEPRILQFLSRHYCDFTDKLHGR
jgi:hypothetical protein